MILLRFFATPVTQFNIGIPTIIPSVLLGCVGTITPLKSPPPSLKSMFDFGMSGPLVGLLGSFAMLVHGLQMTSMMDMNHIASLPSIPTYLLRASTLGGAFIEQFLGSGSLIPDVSSSSLPLHPLAIAGYIGMISNALALLPLGSKICYEMVLSINIKIISPICSYFNFFLRHRYRRWSYSCFYVWAAWDITSADVGCGNVMQCWIVRIG